ncbi:MAG TPA: metalloregulator ArsR/SmtB family transcription factor [Streptosporangiaceae bacterium]
MSKQSPLPMADQVCCSPLVSEPVSEDEAADLAHLFKALADPIRLRLLSLIGAHEGGRSPGAGVCVCDLTGAFAVTAPTISHHLKVLRETGLIAAQRRGTWVYYWILPGVLERLAGLLLPQPVPPHGATVRAATPVPEGVHG